MTQGRTHKCSFQWEQRVGRIIKSNCTVCGKVRREFVKNFSKEAADYIDAVLAEQGKVNKG